MDVKVDEDSGKVHFIYKLKEGHSESFAMNVARIARIPDKVIKKAIFMA